MGRLGSFSGKIVKSIGFRLTLFLAAGLAVYLVMAALSIQALLQQTEGLKELSGLHYERALTAAELSRDAEVIAAQTFESILSTNRSVSQEGAVDQDLVDLYRYVRKQLTATNEKEQGYLDEIDLWQKPYFASLEKLAQRMEEERLLMQQEQELLSDLQKLSEQLLQSPLSDQSGLLAQQIINTCLIALKAEKNGQLFRLEQSAEKYLAQLSGTSSLTQQLASLISRTFDLRKPLILSHRATLASAREARLYSQRLTTSSYNYFQSLKNTAHLAARDYEASAQRAFVMVGVFSVIFLISILTMVVFIRRRLVERLDHLSDTMSAHVAGDPKAIPTDGEDEISVIGQAFEIFVDARNTAEQRLNQAQEETEKANQQLRKLNRQLLVLSETDPLTGVANRRYFDQKLQDHWQMALNLRKPLALIMCDIDRFKAYNDHFGHQAGDECLKQVASTLDEIVHRFPDTLLGRYGGEEFILLQGSSSEEQIFQLAEAMRTAISEQGLQHPDSEHGIVTLSLGTAIIQPDSYSSIDQLIQQADDALYQAKTKGRNLTISAAPSVRLETSP
ncbi:diguanylate cyclase [Oceanospirillum sp. HFRX-1_2]